MPYTIECRKCGRQTVAPTIVNLIHDHTNPAGRFVCSGCKEQDTHIYRRSNLQEEGDIWERWIKGVIAIDSGIPTYCPYVFLIAESVDADVTALHFHYYKDTRAEPGGKLKHGHGPGGPPVLSVSDLFTILERLALVRHSSEGTNQRVRSAAIIC